LKKSYIGNTPKRKKERKKEYNNEKKSFTSYSHRDLKKEKKKKTAVTRKISASEKNILNRNKLKMGYKILV
jgi:hypothetical protein